MARRPKENCDYFPHFTTMRNHRKIKMLRNKFGQVLGYAFWSMIIECLTEAKNNKLEYTEDEIEMFAVDLGCQFEDAKSMIDYCISKRLLKLEKGKFYSHSLSEEYLKPVIEKREKAKQRFDNKKGNNDNSGDGDNKTISVAEPPPSPKITEISEPEQPIQEPVKIEPEPEPEIQYVEAEEVDVFKPRKPRKLKNQPDKILYGTDVRMTLDEYQKLIGEYGNTATERMIQILDNYKVSNGKSYKDDYRAILSWVVDRYQKDQQYGKQQQSNGLSQKGKNADALINSMYS